MPFTYACARCGNPVERHARAKLPRVYCSRACCYADKATVPLRPCRVCGQDFKPKGGSDRPYCSRACYEATRAAKVIKTCTVCGKDFAVIPSNANRYTACSVACKTAETKYVDCERCGTRFRAEKHLNRRFCSEACRRPPVFIDCLTCGAGFRREPSAATRRFCSFACYRRFRGETTLESRVREALAALGIRFEQEFAVGRWSIDFALIELGIALEADGAYWHEASVTRDRKRDAALETAGWRVVRLAERDVKAAADVGTLIHERIHDVPAKTGNSAHRHLG